MVDATAKGRGTVEPGNVFACNRAGNYLQQLTASTCCFREDDETPLSCCNPGCRKRGKDMKRCVGCYKHGHAVAPRYCGQACQKAHWPLHRTDCKRAEDRALAREAAAAAAMASVPHGAAPSGGPPPGAQRVDLQLPPMAI